MNNIKRFNECTGKLFAYLYQHFPRRKDIVYHEWLHETYGEVTDDDYEFCEAALRWLEEAGYISVGSFFGAGAEKVVLTPKGLEVLKAVPDALSKRDSIGDLLVDAVKQGSRGAIASLVSQAFTAGFRLLS